LFAASSGFQIQSPKAMIHHRLPVSFPHGGTATCDLSLRTGVSSTAGGSPVHRAQHPAVYESAPDVPVGSNFLNSDRRNSLSSFTGLPTIIIPGGFFASDGMPFAMQFLGRPFSEPTLIKVASGFEAATKHRKPAPLTPPLSGESFTY